MSDFATGNPSPLDMFDSIIWGEFRSLSVEVPNQNADPTGADQSMPDYSNFFSEPWII
jgi:hypothetical protein